PSQRRPLPWPRRGAAQRQPAARRAQWSRPRPGPPSRKERPAGKGALAGRATWRPVSGASPAPCLRPGASAKAVPCQGVRWFHGCGVFLTGQGCVDKLARLMPGLPQYVCPQRLAESGERIAGQLELRDMRRLRELLYDESGTVTFHLDFEMSEQGFVRIAGGYSTCLRVVCQRCLEPLEIGRAHV